ncbi:COP9 signalosome complex subunit 9 [Lemmus lemmus]
MRCSQRAHSPYVALDEAGGNTSLLMDLAANENVAYTEFFNDFEDLFDDDVQ